jgi:hypothetical protein
MRDIMAVMESSEQRGRELNANPTAVISIDSSDHLCSHSRDIIVPPEVSEKRVSMRISVEEANY